MKSLKYSSSKYRSPIMYHIPGSPGIFNMEEIQEKFDIKGIDIDTVKRMRQGSKQVEPLYIKNNKCENLGRMSLSMALQKFR